MTVMVEANDGDASSLRRLRNDTLIVFLSDTHIGGDPGFDIFESPAELEALFGELATQERPVELVLAGDFFDFLRTTQPPDGVNRAAATIGRPEYHRLFAALRQFAAAGEHRVVYLPGNHDAEMWWNAEIQATLRAEGLVDEFVLSYLACFEGHSEQIIYCEHGNQFDAANAITDYSDPLDSSLGEHIVTDVLHRIVPRGQVSSTLDLGDLNYISPLVAISDWIAGRVFYDVLMRAILYIISPLVTAYLIFRVIDYGIAVTQGQPLPFQQSAQISPWAYTLLGEIVIGLLVVILAFGLFFVGVRRTIGRMMGSLITQSGDPEGDKTEGGDAPERIQRLVETNQSPPMCPQISGNQISVFVSGHTHEPALSKIERSLGKAGVIVNSGCWLRQLHPVKAHLRSPPVFIPVFVQTHVRVSCGAAGIRIELWDSPKPTQYRLPFTERLAILGRQPKQPVKNAKSWVRGAAEL